MLHHTLRRIWILFLFGALISVLGCSGGSNPLTPSNGPSRDFTPQVYTGGTNLGEFTLSLDPNSLTGSIDPVSRQGELIVTPYVKIKIVGLHWDPAARIWDIDVTIENPTKYNAFGPWVVFTDTGDQRILDQDGFIWWVANPGDLPKRVPLIAFCKPNPQRIFNANSIERVHLRIHWPDWVNNFNPMKFFIDVSFPKPRQHPIIEDLKIFQSSPIPEEFTLNAYIKDWQNPPDPGWPGLEAWLDLGPIGLPAVQLFDDGMHGDGMPLDDIWGCNFMAVPPPEPMPLTVHAWDWQGYHFENDVIFGFAGPPPCLPMELLDEGIGGLHKPIFVVIRNWDHYASLWRELHGDQNPPPVDFTREQVVFVNVGDRPSTGYSVHIDCVREEKGPDGVPYTFVAFMEEIPGRDCIVEWVITMPYQIVKTPLTSPPDEFIVGAHEYSCGPECQPIRPLAQGDYSLIHDPIESMFMTQDEWASFWEKHGENTPAPEVKWDGEQVIALMLGDRMTGGYWIRVDCVKFIEDSAGGRVVLVEYTEMIPGPGCPTPDVITQPYFFFAIPRFENARADFIKNEEIYECPPPDCYPFRVLDDTAHSNYHELIEMLIGNQDEWAKFWDGHGAPPPPPEVFWEKEKAVAIVLGDRPTGGFWVRVDCVRYFDDPTRPRYIQVEYTEMIPGPDCIVPQVVTQPHSYIAIPNFPTDAIEFVRHEEVYNCPPPCQPMEVIDEGPMSGFHKPVEQGIRDERAWGEFWSIHRPGTSPPPVNFDEMMVIATVLGDRPSSGFFVTIDCVEFRSVPFAAECHTSYTEHIPGPDCVTNPVITSPYQIVVVPRFLGVDTFTKMDEVYSCQQPDCLPMILIDEGQNGFVHPMEQVITDIQTWHQLWLQLHPDTPPPPVDFTIHQIVVAMLGERPSSGYTVNINCVDDNPDATPPHTFITYTESIPGRTCEVLWVLQYPYQIVMTPKSTMPAEWMHNQIVYECR